MRLKKKATRIVKERKKITIPDLAAELRLREDDLGVLVKTWTAGGGGGYKIVGKKLIGGKMSLDLNPPGVLTWNE